METYFQKGLIEGLSSQWYKNGQPQFKINYKAGKVNGLYIHWYSNGQKASEITYTNGISETA